MQSYRLQAESWGGLRGAWRGGGNPQPDGVGLCADECCRLATQEVCQVARERTGCSKVRRGVREDGIWRALWCHCAGDRSDSNASGVSLATVVNTELVRAPPSEALPGLRERILTGDPSKLHYGMTLTAHLDVVEAVAWSPSGPRVVSASQDGRVIVFDASTGKRLSARGASILLELLEPDPIVDVVWLDERWVAFPDGSGGW